MCTTDADQVFTRAEVARRLKLSEKTLRNWAATVPPKGPRFVHIEGGRVRYPVKDYLEWETAQLDAR
ncbi:helix-turn-helix domain-containing protein [Nocardia sp. CA2R105]|uniref:helix-turn-helix transcriptional regulator n=1 Tax=Nocardia coffeae TaxID=2873381 RepID=UPI001CA72D72|nr:helix-turn-helix domain-containing protein [Nocardia coffeae]MBY8858150.1 helix-turn-helix domain-containing protein [Nocardia coffeae]